jgi:NAD-dependent SIR2 family protein deacetylase
MSQTNYPLIAEKIRNARALVITAGAGMGVDSGLPDFRGDQGFWNAYPLYARLGLSFIDAANPLHFETDPAFGWGFYGHRTNLYRATVPHRGFKLLQRWANAYELDSFIITSNVDGQFQKSGFPEERILEVHGSIHRLQCSTPCCHSIWPNEEQIDIDKETMRALHVPQCPRCAQTARPNILMFGDSSWLHQRTEKQKAAFNQFLMNHHGTPMVVIEIGAGTAIPTIRLLSESLGRNSECTVIRINPRESEIAAPHFSCASSAIEVLEQIHSRLQTA